MNYVASAALASVIALACVGASGEAAGPATRPSASALVRDVQQSELWFDKLVGFHLKAESKWSTTPAGQEARRREIKRQFPDVEPTTRQFPELAAEGTSTLEMTFAPNRLRQEESSPTMYRLRQWDGTRQVDYTLMPDGREFYAINGEPQMGPFFMSNLNWGRTADHHFWWIPKKEDNHNPALDPEDFTLAGQSKYRGIDCYFLSSASEVKTLYVGVADHRLYGVKVDSYSSNGPDGGAVSTAQLDALGRHFGRKFRNWGEFGAFGEKLAPDRQREVARVEIDAIRPFCKPYIEQWMGDYRELAPGCFFPMEEGYALHDLGVAGSPVKGGSVRRFVVVELNPKLDDSLFVAADFHEGAQVDDMVRNISYKQKKDRTPAEWQQLLNERDGRDAEAKAMTGAQDALIGKQAPAFPKGATWVNAAKPIDWAELKGKVVLVDFFAEWCGPCRNDLPHLADLHRRAKETGITVLGIHPPGSERASIDRVLKEFELTFPVCVDTPDPKGPGWGTLYGQYHIYGIPCSFVVDRDGKVAAHGTLAECLGVARKLTGE